MLFDESFFFESQSIPSSKTKYPLSSSYFLKIPDKKEGKSKRTRVNCNKQIVSLSI